MSEPANSRSGLSFLSLLGLLFIGLKLTHVIDWSWWLVLLPFWGPFALAIILLVVFVLYEVIDTARTEIEINRRIKGRRK